MPSIIFDLGVLIGILYLGWLGSAHGIYASAVTALELFVSLSLAVLLYEPIAAFLAPILQARCRCNRGRSFSCSPS
jgi:uncharacterized membrane protein required for colicin V production